MTQVRFLLFLSGKLPLPEVAFSPLKFQCFSLGGLCRSSRHTGFFFNKRCLWKKNVARIVENMMTSHGLASMVIANIAQTLQSQSVIVSFGRKKKMEICGKEIKDECSNCGNILECELFRQGHGIKQERENIAKMIACQMKHREKREFEC